MEIQFLNLKSFDYRFHIGISVYICRRSDFPYMDIYLHLAYRIFGIRFYIKTKEAE